MIKLRIVVEASRVMIRVWDGIIDVEDMWLSLSSVLGMILCTLTAGVAYYWLSSSASRRGRHLDATGSPGADDTLRGPLWKIPLHSFFDDFFLPSLI